MKKPIRNFSYSLISSIVATAIGAVFVLGITGILSGEAGVYTVLETEELHRISGNDFTYIDGNEYNLGLKTKGSYLYSTLGMRISNRGYILIPEGSNSTYITADHKAITFIRDLELIGEFPDKPRMPIGVWIVGNLLTILLGLFFLSIGYLIYNSVKKEKAVKERTKALLNKGAKPSEGDSGNFRSKLTLALCHAAKADKKIAPEEIDAILATVEGLTQIAVSRKDIEEILEILPPITPDVELGKIGDGLNESQKWMIIQACILIVASDGKLENEELTFTFKLGVGFGFSEKEIFEKYKNLGLTKE